MIFVFITSEHEIMPLIRDFLDTAHYKLDYYYHYI